MNELHEILLAFENGDRISTNEIFPRVYAELKLLASRRMAEEQAGHTLQTTALVHEAYLRLVDQTKEPQWQGKTHFFAAAAEAMRRILVDNARKKDRLKRGGEWIRVGLEATEEDIVKPGVDLLALDEALDELEKLDPRKAELVKLRYFGGLTVEDAAAALGISVTTAVRSWRYSRAWLADKMTASSQQ